MHTLLINLLLCVAATHGSENTEGPELSPDSYDPADVIYRDVAIIGGGAAGTYSAVRLVDHNLSVAIIEPKGQLGGHAETYVDPGTGVPVNIGVQIFEPFQLTVDYFTRFGVPLVPFSAAPPPSGPSLFVNFDTGEAVDFEPPSQEEVGAGFAAYGQQLGRHPDIVSGYGDLNYPVDEDLLLPFGEFAEKYQIDGAVRSLFDFEQGYSPLLELPTIYVLKQFGPGLLQAFSSGTLLTTERRNTQELYERVTEFLGGGQVLLNTSVVSMSRGDATQQPCILVDGPDGKKLIVARKVLITAPLINVYQSRDAFDVDEEEAALFSQLFANGYYTGIISNPSLPETFTAVGADPARPYGIPELPGLYTIRAVPGLPGLFNVYYGIPKPTSAEEVRRDIEAIVGKVLAAQGLPAGETEWVIFSDHSPYNSMASPEAIRAGFYKELLGLQGRRDTFYTGATWDTQDSGTIWNYTEERVLPQILESLG